MESSNGSSPRARLRFGFKGKRNRPRPAEDPSKLSTDDLLDSLTRQASTQVGFGEYQQKGFDVLVDEEDSLADFEQSETAVPGFRALRNRSFGRFAFVIMLVGGMLAVWLYGSGSRLIDTSSLNSLIQTSAIRAVFINPAQLSIISLIAVLAAVWVAHRRKRAGIKIPN